MLSANLIRQILQEQVMSELINAQAAEAAASTRNDQGAAATSVGPSGAIAVGVYLVATAWFSAYSLLALWPIDQGTPSASAGTAGVSSPLVHTTYFGGDIVHSAQQGTI